ncbi:MAG: hypothetical protein F2840_05690 [Actinobacteria bacterium]|nr:hypothetical protein [Actinomycetota bacterium]
MVPHPDQPGAAAQGCGCGLQDRQIGRHPSRARDRPVLRPQWHSCGGRCLRPHRPERRCRSDLRSPDHDSRTGRRRHRGHRQDLRITRGRFPRRLRDLAARNLASTGDEQLQGRVRIRARHRGSPVQAVRLAHQGTWGGTYVTERIEVAEPTATSAPRGLWYRLGPIWSLVSLLVIVYFVTLINSFLGESVQVQLQYALVNLIIVVALQIFIGTSGVLSFGHVAFVAVGAWTVGLLTIDPELKRNLLPDLFPFLFDLNAPWLIAVLIGGVVGGLLALVVSPVLMRLNGLQAGIATFALLGVVNQVLTYWSSVGPRSGQSMVGIPDVLNLQTTMLFAMAAIVAAWLFQRTRPSRLLRAAREDGIAAASSGINVVSQRIIVFAVSGIVAGVAGGLFALTNRVVQSSQLNIELTFVTLAMLVLGGMLSLSGAVIGTLVFSLVDVLLVRLQNGLEIGAYVVTVPQGARAIILGLILVGMLLFRPSGITGGREFVWPFRKDRPLPGMPPTNES